MRILDGKPEGKRPLGRPSRKEVDNTEMELSQWITKCVPRIPRDPRPVPTVSAATFPYRLLRSLLVL